MQIAMIGLGRMGGNMARRLIRAGHTCVAYDVDADAVTKLVSEGAIGAHNYRELVGKLEGPRVLWLMLPAALVDHAISELTPLLQAGDIIVDGGNTHYVEDIRRARELQAQQIHYVDVGTSGGVWGLTRGYCLMIGGERGSVEFLDPIFRALAPLSAEPTKTSAENGYLHCGPAGAGHFVKMVHNGIEYGLMAAYAEGFNILRHAGLGKHSTEKDAETAPLKHPEHYQYDFDLGQVAELWRHGSVITSWLLDLTATALGKSPELSEFSGSVSDSGEGRWTVQAAIDEAVPAHVLTASLFERFSSRGRAEFGNKVLSAMRLGFGGHHEKTAKGGHK